MLNSGEVPNLFEKDELKQVLAAVSPKAKEFGISEGNRDEVNIVIILSIQFSLASYKVMYAQNCIFSATLWLFFSEVRWHFMSLCLQVFQFFISHVREKLHIVLCMSPVGDAFRSRCRMFPSLVNCCTIDWFVQVRLLCLTASRFKLSAWNFKPKFE